MEDHQQIANYMAILLLAVIFISAVQAFLPNKKRKTNTMKKYCLGFMFNKKLTDVLLIEKQKPEWQKGFINGIGGKIEQGENSLDAIIREFREETGIDSNKEDWHYVITMSGDDWQVDVYTSISDSIFYASRKEMEVPLIINIFELDRYNLISNLYWLIPMCLDKQINYTINNNFQNEKS